MSEYELPESRLATTDETGKRVYIHPHDLRGIWKNRRTIFSWFLIIVYLVLPWITIDGQQIIRLDLPARNFYLFGYTFYGHDGPFLLFVLLSFVFFISFLTTIYGRVWCGWACPQTVFIDVLYRRIERLIEGTGAKRDKLEKAPWNLEKILKRSVKWLLFILVSLHIVHSGIGYFVGTRELFFITTQSPASHPSLFILMLTLTLIILIDFGWFREQFCIIACPYGRFQSIVMDENSLIISYKNKRGEPRKRSETAKQQGSHGDCVNCNRCVHVCPTGIDIRDGLQMECIACTMCIDACDDIMLKVGKPKGLISYTSENQLRGKKKKISVRSYVYASLFLITFISMVLTLSDRSHLKIQLIRSGNSAFQLIKSEKKVINFFDIKYRYNNDEKIHVKIHLSDPRIELISTEEKISLKNENLTQQVFVKAPINLFNRGKKEVTFKFMDEKTGETLSEKSIQIVGPILGKTDE